MASGASLAPGTSIGTLTFGSDLGLSGTTSIEINKTTGGADKIVMSSGTVTLGGNLTVVNLAGTLAKDDTFDLVDGTIANSFASFTLPSLPTGLAWDATQLSAGGNGTIKVVCDGTLTAPDSNAGNVTNQTVVLSIEKLLRRATGTGLYVSSVTSPSALGRTVTRTTSDGGYTGTISYTASSSPDTDSFTYTITDVNGCTVSPTIYVTNAVNSGFSPNYVQGSGHFEDTTWIMQFQGIPGITYGIEWASSASGPWTRLTPDVTADGVGLITGSDSSGGSSRYYRTVYP